MRRIGRGRIPATARLRAVAGTAFVGLVLALPAQASSLTTDPLWWRAAVGADHAQPAASGKPVTVIDTGIDVSHPAFAGLPPAVALNPQTTAGLAEAHGTMVSSVVLGVYPNADLEVWDATPSAGEFSGSSVIAGLAAAAARGPGVVNMSFGSFRRDPGLEKAIAIASRAGVIVVAAAGNDRGSGSRDLYPASLPHVLTVGATDSSGAFTVFSSATPGLDLVAPGQDIRVAAPASSISSGSTTADGTSFSAPIVAGAAAWVWTARPDLDQTQIVELLRLSASDLGRPGYDADTGFGLLDIRHALAMVAPPPDPGEPNEDIPLVKPGGWFPAGARPVAPGTRILARLDFSEDPEDVYRIAVPAHTTVIVTLLPESNADLELWRSGTRSVSEAGAARARDLIGASARPGNQAEAVTIVNHGAKAEIVYADVFPAQGVRATQYGLTVRKQSGNSSGMSGS